MGEKREVSQAVADIVANCTFVLQSMAEKREVRYWPKLVELCVLTMLQEAFTCILQAIQNKPKGQ
jgi:hypothetical protein